MARREQFKFWKFSVVHGGEGAFRKRKVARPISTQKPMAVTLKASGAVGKKNFHLHRSFIEKTVATLASRFGIRVYERSINTNHIHLVFLGRTREGIRNFLRSLPAQVATQVTGARRGKPHGKRFWDFPLHTRIVEWGKAFRRAVAYVIQNHLETTGQISYTPRPTS